ncbi:MAG: enoyl-CoA hydratase/isomerase family protein [Pseudomonadota bacterium]
MSSLICERRGRVTLLTLNRENKKNALSRELRDELVACLQSLRPEETGAVVLTGSGTVFCAGFDLAEFASGDMQAVFAHATAYHHAVFTTPIPLIAAVNGPAYAGGFDLAAMCDVRIAGTSARFAQPQVKMGIPAAYDLMRHVLPESVAREVCLTGEPLGSAMALQHGFVSQVVDDAEVLPTAMALAERVADSKGAVAMKARFVAAQPPLFG